MSQTVRFAEIDGVFYPEVLSAFPDKEDAISMIQDLIEDGSIPDDSESYEVSTNWYEIGSGESGTDELFSDEVLIEKIKSDGIDSVKCMTESAGYDYELIQNDTITIDSKDIEVE